MSDTLENAIENALYGTNDGTTPPLIPAEGEPPPVDLEATSEIEDDELSEETIPPKAEEGDDDSLAAMLGVPEEALEFTEDGKVLFTTEVDGKEIKVNFNDLVSTYKSTDVLSSKAAELAQQQQLFEQQSQKVQQEMAAKVQQMGTVSKLLEAELVAEYKNYDWKVLAETQPAEYNRLRNEFGAKLQRVKEVQKNLAEEAQNTQTRFQEQQQAQMAKHIKSQEDQLMISNPTWHDEKVKTKEIGELRTFLTEQFGFQEQELEQIYDARLVRLIQTAYKNSNPANTLGSKKQDNVPAFQKPGAGRVAAAANARAAKAKKAALRRSGSQSDLTAVLMDRM